MIKAESEVSGFRDLNGRRLQRQVAGYTPGDSSSGALFIFCNPSTGS